jgi:Zn-finger nucleic acid-binding protein
LRTVDKAGVHLEQCENCRGIFLDHGELEHILQAEQRYYGGGMPAYGGGHGGRPDSPGPLRHRPDSPRPYRGEHHGHSDSPRPYRGEHHGHGDSPRPYGHRRSKGSFLGDLFG